MQRRGRGWKHVATEASLQQAQKFIYGQTGAADECAQRADGEFSVLGNRKFARTPDFTRTRWLPTWPTGCQPAFWKAFAASLPETLASLPIPLDSHHNFRLFPLFL